MSKAYTHDFSQSTNIEILMVDELLTRNYPNVFFSLVPNSYGISLYASFMTLLPPLSGFGEHKRKDAFMHVVMVQLKGVSTLYISIRESLRL